MDIFMFSSQFLLFIIYFQRTYNFFQIIGRPCCNVHALQSSYYHRYELWYEDMWLYLAKYFQSKLKFF